MKKKINVDTWPHNQKNPSVFVKQLRNSGFADYMIEKILDILDGLCTDCWNKETQCSCYKHKKSSK